MRSQSLISKVRLVISPGHCEAVWSTWSAQLAKPLLFAGGVVESDAGPEQAEPAMTIVNTKVARSIQQGDMKSGMRVSIHP
jgi:hypothetical protein